jgi:hypothetical protein
MKPTTIGQPSSAVASAPTTSPTIDAAPLDFGAIALAPDQVPRAEATLAALDFSTIAPGDIVKLGLDAERSLQETLDGFLSRLDKNTAAKLFDLFGRLEKGVEDAQLPDLLKRIQEGEKPSGIMARLRGKFPEDLFKEFMDEVGALVAGRTQTLADQMRRLESELNTEMQTLFAELQQLDRLKGAYSRHFGDFTVSAAAARAFLERAKAYVEAERTQANPADVVAQARLRELDDKVLFSSEQRKRRRSWSSSSPWAKCWRAWRPIGPAPRSERLQAWCRSPRSSRRTESPARSTPRPWTSAR